MNQLIHDRTDYRRLAELYEEFDELWTRLQAFYLDAVAGFRFVASYVQAEQGEARSFVQGSDMDLSRPRTNGFSATIKSFRMAFALLESIAPRRVRRKPETQRSAPISSLLVGSASYHSTTSGKTISAGNMLSLKAISTQTSAERKSLIRALRPTLVTISGAISESYAKELSIIAAWPGAK